MDLQRVGARDEAPVGLDRVNAQLGFAAKSIFLLLCPVIDLCQLAGSYPKMLSSIQIRIGLHSTT